VTHNLLSQDVPQTLAAAGRRERVRALVEAAEALVAGRAPSRSTARFLGHALRSWLQQGGDLEVHLGTRGPRGSRETAYELAKRFANALCDQSIATPHREESKNRKVVLSIAISNNIGSRKR